MPAPLPGPSTPAAARGSRLYLDASGSAPVHAVAREAYLAALDEGWADPRRLHAEGRRAHLLLAGARQSLAEVLGARTEEVRFAPSLTAALHAAVTAVTLGRRRVGASLVASAVERQVVLDAATARADGTLVTVPVDGLGRVDLDHWADAVAADGVALAALQHANGEVGTRQPVREAHELTRTAGVPLLVDAAASLGHTDVAPDWDVLVADPADWGSVPGLAVVGVRAGVRTAPMPGRVPVGGTAGAGDDEAWAPGGVSVPAALAAAASLRAVLVDREGQARGRADLVERIRRQVAARVPDVEVLGPGPAGGLPHVVAFSCLYVDGEALLSELDRRGIAVGSGSACTSELGHPSHVLAAMGVLTHGNVRLCLPTGVTEDQIERFCSGLAEAVRDVRHMLGADAW